MADINKYDIMQHIRNIYNILGIDTPANETFEDTVQKLRDQGKLWVGTKENYEIGVGNGTINPTNLLVVITND